MKIWCKNYFHIFELSTTSMWAEFQR